jgi:hypothetical protein
MGYVYIFVNDWMPKLVKIGITDDLEQRLKDSAKDTFVPCAFNCYYAIKSDQDSKLEKFIHTTYDMFRVNDKREFFEINPDRAKTMLKGLVDMGVATEIDDNQTQQISQNVSEQLTKDGEQLIFRRRQNTTFKMLGIEIGSELVYKNDETKKVKTIDEINNVEYEGEIFSISNLSDKLTGYRTSGYEYFRYDGKLLGDIRRDIDSNE